MHFQHRFSGALYGKFYSTLLNILYHVWSYISTHKYSDEMKKRLLIYGAGAIGRGYIPWLFPSKDYEFSFVESNG